MSDALESAQDAVETNANPFALSEDHEFAALEEPESNLHVASDAEPIPDDVFESSVLFDKIPAHPGTPESDFRKCPCIGVMPGRACPRCNCSKWVKTCQKCNGAMFVGVQSRRGAHARTERCGFCMGLGQVAARLEEVREAGEAAAAYKPDVAPAKTLERSVRLPVANSFTARAAKKAARRVRG